MKIPQSPPQPVPTPVPKVKKYSFLKSVGKGLATVGKGVLVIAPIILEDVIPILKGNGVAVSKWIIVGLGIAKVITNRQKNKDKDPE